MKSRIMDRRTVLGLLAGTLTGLAGCTSRLPGSGPGTTRHPCENLIRPVLDDAVEDGPVDGFRLQLVETPDAVGDRLVVELRNETDSEAVTGNRYRYVVQRKTADGWEAVQRVDEDGSWTDDTAGPHPPGEGFRWEFTFSTDGLTREHDDDADNADYYVCEDLPSGTYRFVYFGLIGDTAVASAPFTVEDDDGGAGGETGE